MTLSGEISADNRLNLSKTNMSVPLLLGRNARWPRRPLVSRGELRKYIDGTDGLTPDRYITISAKCGHCNNITRGKSTKNHVL